MLKNHHIETVELIISRSLQIGFVFTSIVLAVTLAPKITIPGAVAVFLALNAFMYVVYFALTTNYPIDYHVH